MTEQPQESQPARKVEGATRTREFHGPMNHLVNVIAIGLSLYTILYVGGIFSRLDIYIGPGTHRGIAFACVMTLLFLLVPAAATSPRHRVPWYDIVLILMAVGPSIYYAVIYDALLRRDLMANMSEAFLAVPLVLAILEGARRAVGLVLSILGAMFFLYPFVSPYLPGLLYARPHDFRQIMQVMYFYPSGIFGDVWQITSTIIVVYLVFGAFLNVSGAGKFFIDVSLGLLGHTRGGPAKVAVLSSSFFASISGSAIANAVSTGVITIPLMKATGYRPTFAAAVEAVASNGGPLTPPIMAALAFIMAEFLKTTYFAIMIAAIAPAMLYYIAAMVMIHIEAVRTGLKGVPRPELPPLWKTLREGWFYVLPVAMLVFFLAIRYSAQTACIYTLGAYVVISWFKKERRMGPRQILSALGDGSRGLPSVGVAVAIAGVLMGALAVTGLMYGLAGDMVNLVQGNTLLLLVLSFIVCLVLGMGAPTTPVYLISAITMVPALTMSGVPPIAAHFFVLYTAQASMLTPPVCLVSYVTASIAGANFMKVGLEAVRLGVVIFILPFAFIYSPQLLLVSDFPWQIVLTLAATAVAVVFLSIGLQGYLYGKVAWLARGLLVGSGLLLFFPDWRTYAVGLAAGFLPVMWQLWGTRAARSRVRSGTG